MNLSFPLRIARGRAAVRDDDAHARDLIEQLLFTVPGERVDRPDFGCGVHDLLFGAASPDVAAAAQVLLQGALQRWRGEVASIEDVAVEADGAALRVTVRYTLARGGRVTSTFTREA